MVSWYFCIPINCLPDVFGLLGVVSEFSDGFALEVVELGFLGDLESAVAVGEESLPVLEMQESVSGDEVLFGSVFHVLRQLEYLCELFLLFELVDFEGEVLLVGPEDQRLAVLELFQFDFHPSIIAGGELRLLNLIIIKDAGQNTLEDHRNWEECC
jgi:hypothetical protein